MVQVSENGPMAGFTTLNAALTAMCVNQKRGVVVVRSSKDEEFLSYAELYARACYTLANLRKLGVQPGHELMIQVDDSKEFLVLFWACLLGGIIAVPLSTGVQEQQKSKVLNVARTLHHPYWIGTTESLQRIRKIALEIPEDATDFKAYIEDRSLSLIDVLAQHEVAEPIDVQPQSIAYIQFSSGSTGTPKGVTLTHANLIANTKSIIERTGIVRTDSMLSWMPLTHDMGLICFHLSGVVAGLTQYIMPTALFIRTPLLWLEKAGEHRVNYLYSPNFGLQYALSAFEENNTRDWDLSSVKCIYNGAEPISAELCRQFMAAMKPYGLAENAMFPGYGLAEASVAVTLPKPGDLVKSYIVNRQRLSIGQPVEELFDATQPDALTLVEVGYSIPRTEVRIADDTDRVLVDDTIGHIQIRGENVTQGYYNNSQATERVFTADGWLRTGDLGYLHQGRLVVSGRLKELIIVNGQNYYPHDIERVAQKVAGIELGKVVATSRWDARQNKEEVLLFVLFKKQPEQFVSLVKALQAIILQEVGIAVDKVLPCRRIFKTTSGKIQRFQFLEAYNQGEFDAAWQTIQARLEADVREELTNLSVAEKLSACWQTATGRTFEVAENVYSLGVTSLQLTQFVARFNQATGIRLTVGDVLQADSLGDLARLITQEATTPAQDIVPTLPQGDYPVTDAQQRLWFTDQYTGGTSAYNIAVGFVFQGEIDTAMLNRAFGQVIERYEILRTAFVDHQGETRQRILPSEEVGFSLAIVDAGNVSKPALDERIEAEANTHFDLTSGKLVRATLYRQAEQANTLLLVMHHSIADGWSVGVLMRDVVENYRQLLAGQKSVQLPLPIQYKDYATWQATQSPSEESLAYWKNRLEPNHPVLDFPTYGNRSPIRSRKGQTITYSFAKASLQAVSELAREHQATHFMVLLAMVNATLYRYTGQTDLIVGTDVANRQSDQLVDQVGYFLNTVCVRTEFSADTTFTQLITNVKQRFLEGLAHQQVSFETLLNVVDIARDPSRSPLFDVLVVFQNFEPVRFEPTSQFTAIGSLSPAINETIVDLHLELTEQADELSLQFRYNSDLYASEQIQQFCRHLEDTLLACRQNTQQPLWQYELSTGQSRQCIDKQQVEFPSFGASIIDYLRRSVEQHRSRVAVTDETGAWTYDQLWNKANGLAQQLLQQGLEPEECVGVLMPRSTNAIATLVGILKAGGAYVPLDMEQPVERLRYIAKDANLRLVVSAEAGLSAKHGLEVCTELVITNDWAETNLSVDVPRNGSDLAYVLYTSGTTGMPKGVEIEHHSLLDYVQTFTDYFQLDANDDVVQQSSLAFDTSVEEIFPALLQGGNVRVVRGGGKDIEGIVQAIADGATVVSVTPLVINELNQEAHRLAGHLRLVISGGDVLRYDQVDKLVNRCRVVNTYGPTESTVCVCYEEIKANNPTIWIGAPIANRNVIIVGADGQQQPTGVFGELWIGGTGLARGYRNNPALTQQQFVNRADGRFYRSGDWVRMREDGRLEFAGRRDNQVKIRGYRVELEEIEQIIGRCAGVDAVAVSVRTDHSGNQLSAFYVGEATEEIFGETIRQALPHYMIPAYLTQLSALPRTTSGKVDRKALQAYSVTAASLPVARELTAFEKQIAEVWADVLGVQSVELTGNFFALGGHSIKGVRANHRLSQRLGLTIELAELFQYPVLEAFAAHLAQKSRNSYIAIQPVPQQYSYPLSPSQRGMWLLQQVNPDSPAYNIAFALKLTGDLNRPAFNQTWQQLLERHESLRTVFREEPDGVRQLILAPEQANFAVQWLDGAGQSDQAIQHQLQALAALPFTLSVAPLLRVTALAVSNNRWILSVVMHHIVGDDWSAGVMLREALGNYTKLVRNQLLAAEPLAIQYKDYAAWQAQQLSTEPMQAHRRFWQMQLADELPVLQLPADGNRAAMKGYAGASTTITVAAELTESIRQLAQANGLSEYMVWMSALKLLLFHYTGQRDLIVGCPVAGRNHPDLEEQIGCYVNTLPLRTQLDDTWSIADYLQQVRRTTLAAYEHQAYPFAELVEDLPLNRDPSRSLVFDVLLTLQNATDAANPFILEQLTAKPYSLPTETCKFDWDIDIRPNGNERIITVAFDTQLYSSARMERMIRHFVNIVQAICGDTTAPIRAVDFLNTTEKEQLLRWSVGQPSLPTGHNSIVDLLKSAFETYADQPAVEDGQTRWTYQELQDWSNRLANKLTALGLQPEECVGICMPRSVWMTAAVLGILKAGGAYVPLDINYPVERLKYMVDDAGIDVILVAEAGTLDRLGIYSAREVVMDPTSLALTTAKAPTVSVSADQLAYVLYTSGSTGLPKGVEIEHRNTVAFLTWCREEFADAHFDLGLAVTSLNFDLSVFELLYPLVIGKTIRLLESGLWLADYLPTVQSTRLMINTVPSVVEMLLRTNVNLGNVTVLNMAGEPISSYVRQRLNYDQMQVRNLYGPTEDTTYSTCFRLINAEAVGKIGTPKRGTQAYVLSQSGQLQPVGVPGEICLSGAGQARGYRNRWELTQSRFVNHPFQPEDRLYRTGDWGYWGEDGQLVCIGRIDNQVKLRGYRVELGEIERKIEAGGAEQAVVLVVGEGGAQQLVAFYQSANASPDTLTTYLQVYLPAWMVPQQLIPLVQFPQTLTGKIDRRQLVSMIPADVPVATDAQPWTPTELRMKPLWEVELNLTTVRPTDNFFGLGGHSLKATQLLARIRTEWQLDIPLKAIFLHPTIAGLSQFIDQLATEEQFAHGAIRVTETVPATPGRYPLSTVQEQFWVAHQLEGHGRSYHMPFAATLTGRLNFAAFEQAWAALVARHESLRTVFLTDESDMYQQVLTPEQLGFTCRMYDLQADENAIATATAGLQALVDEPFDLQTGPLLRVAVWQTNADTYELGIVFHHLVCDGWSLGVIIREIFDAYNAYCAQRGPNWTPLAVQYGDYARWEKQHQQTKAWADSKQYWVQQLTGELPVLSLPTSGSRRLARQSKACAVERVLDSRLTEQLDLFAQQQQVSLYSLLLAGLSTVLYRYTHQTDQLIGCAAAGRGEEPWQQQIGLYVNTLALRQQLNGADTFQTLLQNVQQTVLDAYVHQDFGFGALIEALGVRHEKGRWPLFDLMFTLQEAEWDVMSHRQELTGLRLTKAVEPDTMPKYDLNITVSAANPERTIRARFDPGLFTAEQIERLLMHYERILLAVLDNSQISLDQIDYLTVDEKEQLFAWGNPAWKNTQSTETITSCFARQVAETPNAVAILHEASTWTYADLDAWSDRVAAELRQHYAVQPGEKVGLLTSRSPWAVVGMLGILKAGGAYVPIESKNPDARIAYMLQDSDVRVLLTDDITHSQATTLFNGEVVNVQNVPEVTTFSELIPLPITSDQLAYVMYTSGSTGNPKGVLVEHRGVVRLVRDTNYITFSPSDRLLMTGALSFDATTFEIWGMLLNGGQLCIVSNEWLLDTALFQQILMSWDISMLWMTAAWFDQVVDADPFLFESLKWLLVGGDALSPPHIAKVKETFPNLTIINGYGPTENTTFSLCHRIDSVGAGSIPIGKPIAQSSVYILDQHCQLVPIGIEGEIHVGGEGLARGYQNQPTLTAEKFIDHPFEPGQRVYKTGDIGRWLPDGTVEYIGRADNQVKIRGYRIEMGEIENALMRYPDIKQAVVLVEATPADKRLIAYYVSENQLDESDLRLFLQRDLPTHFIPNGFVWVANMPLTPNGKTDRAALHQLRVEQAALPIAEPESAPVTELEQTLLNIWQDVLDRQLSNPEANFFDVGGHSLRATKLVMQLRKQLGVNVPLAKIFENPTVRSLAQEISPAIEAITATQTDQLLEEITI